MSEMKHYKSMNNLDDLPEVTEATNFILKNVESSSSFVLLKERYFSSPSFGTKPNSVEDSPIFIPLKHSSRSLSFRGGGGTSKGVITNVNTGVSLGVWILPALACALAYALYNISIKKASNDINPVLGGVILQFVAAFLGSFIYMTERQMMDPEEETLINMYGISWSIAAGLFVGIAEILSFCVNGKGVPATQSIPVIIGGSVFFGTVLGNLFLGEAVSARGWLGVFFIMMGITIVSMEPGT